MSRRGPVCSYLSWNEETRLDGSSYEVVIAYDPEIISHLDLGDLSLFLFPGLGPSSRSSSWHTTDDTLSTETSCSHNVEKLVARSPSLAGTGDRWPTYWTSENAYEDMSAPRVCSFQGLIDDCESKWFQQSPDTLSSVGTPENSHDTNWKCEVCGRRCRDAKALQQHKRCHLKPYQCSDPTCYLRFSTRRDLNRHRYAVHEVRGVTNLTSCPHCPKRFSRSDNLRRHVKRHQETPTE